MHDKLVGGGAEITRCCTHGNGWSIYLKYPEGNLLEIYAHTPWHIPQPYGYPIDFVQSDEQIMATTEAHCHGDPAFAPAAAREAQMARLMGRLN
jgi:catechol 2,3-dioxygenase